MTLRERVGLRVEGRGSGCRAVRVEGVGAGVQGMGAEGFGCNGSKDRARG